MQKKIVIKLVIIAAMIVIVIAGWIIGSRMFLLKQNNSNANSSPSNDVLVYTVKEGGKVSFHKSPLNVIAPKSFYSTDEKSGGVSIINNVVTAEVVKDAENHKYEYFTLSLSGDRSSINSVEIPDNQGFLFEGIPYKEIRSANGEWSTKVEKENPEEAMGIDGKLIIQSATERIIFNKSDFPHSSSFNFIRPERFSSDNTIFVTLLQAESDPGGGLGLYQIDFKNRKIKEIIYIANNDYPFSSIHLQPSARNAYYIHGGKKILTQINIATGEKSDIYSSLPEGYQLVFQSDEKTIIFNPPFDTGQAIQVFDIQTKTIKIIPVISGQFQAISSDKNYLAYSKYSEKPGDASFSNVDHITAMERKILITEYYVLDIATGKDSTIFTNKMILSDSGSYVGLDGKEYSFVGLISSGSK